MKYHYQYVSPLSVRIELIADDPKEMAVLEKFKASTKEDTELSSLFETALQSYTKNLSLTKIKFMDFPRVALISFKKVQDLVNA